MFSHSTNTASFFSVLIAAVIFLLFAAGGSWAAKSQDNTDLGKDALKNNTTGIANTAIGVQALFDNTIGNFNTAIGANADVSAVNLSNATAIGFGAIVNASNKIRLRTPLSR